MPSNITNPSSVCFDGSSASPPSRRVVQLISGDGRGGADQVALRLGRGLREREHEVVFAVPPRFHEFRDLHAEGFAVLDIARFRGFPLATLTAFNRHVADADLVLTHDSGARHFALMAKLLGLKPPVWFMRHCISGTSRWGGTQLHRLLVQHHIAVSDVVADSLARSGLPARQISRIYGGADLSAFAHPDPAGVERMRATLLGAQERSGAEGERPLVLGMVARFSRYPAWRPDLPDFKGYDVLFRALAGAAFPYRVLVCGPENRRDQDALREMSAHYGVDPGWLVFAGFQPDMTLLYPLMDINVLPSRREGLGLAVIEGMAAGMPVIASRSGGIVEIVRDGRDGLLFPEGDARVLGELINGLAADTGLRSRLGMAGRTRVMAEFDAAVMVDRFEALMFRVLPAVS